MDPLLAPPPVLPAKPTVMSLSFARFVQHPIATILSLCVMGAAFSLPLLMTSLIQHASQASQHFNQALDFSVFLDPSFSDAAARDVSLKIQQLPHVHEVTVVSKEQGLNEFRSWSNLNSALDNLPENPLPATIIVRPQLTQSADLDALVKNIQVIKGVQKVRVDARWAARFVAWRDVLTELSDWLLSVSVAIAVIVMVTVLHLDLRGRYYALITRVPADNRVTWLRKTCLFEGLWLATLGASLGVAVCRFVLWAMQPWVSALAHSYQSEFTLSGPDPLYAGLGLLAASLLGLFAGSISSRV
jgi:cell division transport system permease protein